MLSGTGDDGTHEMIVGLFAVMIYAYTVMFGTQAEKHSATAIAIGKLVIPNGETRRGACSEPRGEKT